MDSTAHHHQGPSSLPSDYGLVARYAQYNNIVLADDASPPGSPPGSSPTRRNSLGHRRARHTSPTIMRRGGGDNSDKKTAFPSESTPLLQPVSRIAESIASDASSLSENDSRGKMLREELPILTRYALPVFGTHVLEYSLVVASVVSIGHLSTHALAAISLGSMTASVSAFSVLQGLTSALDTLLPPAWTSSQPQLVGLWSQRMYVVVLVCLIPMYIVWFNAEGILLSLKQEPEVARLAAKYLRWVSLSLPAYGFNCTSRRYFQAQGLFWIPTRIIMFVAPFNALLNYTLVWGPEPVRLGFIGAPLATAISFNLVSLLSIICGIFFVPKTAWHPLSGRMFTGLGVLVRLGVSGVGQVASEWWAWELVALAASLLGPAALATQSILLVSTSTTFQAPFALSVATSVRIGNLLGEHRPRRAGVAAIASLVLTFIIAVLTSALFLTFRNTWAYIFNDDPEVVAAVAAIIPLVALFQLFDGAAAVTGGILRAQGKQLTGAILNLSAYYVIGIPFGILLAFKYGMGLHGIWIGLTVSLVYCAILGTWFALRTDWQQQVEKVERRMAAETGKSRIVEDMIDQAGDVL